MVYDIDLTPFSVEQRKEIMKGFYTKPDIPFWEYCNPKISPETMEILRSQMVEKKNDVNY